MRERLVSWTDYLYIGIAFAVLLSMKDEYRDGFLEIILVSLFFVVTGLKNNISNLFAFIKKHSIFAVLTVMWMLYFLFIEHASNISYRYSLSIFFIVFAGYSIAVSTKGELTVVFNRLWMILFVTLLIGTLDYFVVHDFSDRMHMAFLHPIAEGNAALVLAFVSLFYVKDKRKMIAGTILSALIMIIAQLRHVSALLLVLLVIFVVINWHGIKAFFWNSVLHSIKGRIMWSILFLLLVILVLFISIKGTTIEVIENLINRFAVMFAAINKDVYLNYYGDKGFRNRVADLDFAINVWRNGNLQHSIFGGGMLYTYSIIKPLAALFLGITGDTAGPVENSFISLLSDYGMAAFILYTSCFISAISTSIKSKIKSVRTISLLVAFIMLVSAFSDMIYWINIAFLIFVLIGVYLGELAEYGETRALYPALVFAFLLSIFIYALPITYLWLRTAIMVTMDNIGVMATMLVLFITFAVVLIIIWSISFLLVSLVFDKRIIKSNAVTVIISTVALLLLLTCGMFEIIAAKKYVIPRINDEKEVLTTIVEHADGEVYNDTYPYLYNKEIGGIKASIFSGASLGAQSNTTVIMDVKDEAQVLINAGFLYTPISETDVVYTNDDAVIKVLEDRGHHLTGYCTNEYAVDLDDLAAANGLGKADDGAVIIDGQDQNIENGIMIEIYPGKYTATYELVLRDNNAYVDDYQVCTIKLTLGKDKESASEVISTPVMRSEFDEAGKLSKSLIFQAGAVDYNYLLVMDSNDSLELRSIKYRRTPDFDTRRELNNNYKVIQEEYFDLEGKPIVIANGYHGANFEYKDLGYWTSCSFFDLNFNPIASISGAAKIEREYDEAGNIIVERYYDVENDPILNYGEYWYIVRAYNDKRQVIHEEFYGLNNELILRPDGYCSIDIRYDETGAIAGKTYYNLDGEIVNEE
ncbi:hypothetical protein [Butyrivibrio sp. LC3010]|uniref:hypothetical protein n=1 Tax=Butyrivibrio sp. LC3010 TaxID=1280680 RepID=UPI0004789161|nr:hypothetical protein [Butyrivibrio sp. LC3010]